MHRFMGVALQVGRAMARNLLQADLEGLCRQRKQGPDPGGIWDSVWFEPHRVGTRDNQRGGQFAVVVAPE
jgi:hypothetical protein